MEKSMARAFGLDGDAWLRHGNPWSVCTRIPAPAALVAAIWTYAWTARRCPLNVDHPRMEHPWTA
jgi:hypothetical protein